MKPFPRKVVAITLSICTLFQIGSVVADEAEMLGVWCASDGREMMFWEHESIGFNEHTICELGTPLVAGAHLVALIECANVYVYEGETVRAFEETKLFNALQVSPDRLDVIIGWNAKPVQYERCFE